MNAAPGLYKLARQTKTRTSAFHRAGGAGVVDYPTSPCCLQFLTLRIMVSPPSVGSHLVVSVYPKEKVLVLRLHRPEVLNAVNAAVSSSSCGHRLVAHFKGPQLTVDIAKVLDWFEAEPSLWCCIVTGTGRAFCAGSDLKQMRAKSVDVTPTKPGSEGILAQPDGFASISLRRMRKPIIAGRYFADTCPYRPIANPSTSNFYSQVSCYLHYNRRFDNQQSVSSCQRTCPRGRC